MTFPAILNRDKAQYANDKIEELTERKLLNLNLKKTCFLLVGNSRGRNKLKMQIQNHPLTIFGERMKLVETLKFLGDVISHSPEDSIHKTVLKRLGVDKQTMTEIRTIIEHIRAKYLVGIYPKTRPGVSSCPPRLQNIPMQLHNIH